jgi:hypothetical protein
MDNSPYSYLDWEENNTPSVIDIKVVTIFGENKIKPLYVIVEGWDKRLFGRVKRAYLAEFNDKERMVISRWHTHLYQWFMRT